MTALFSFLFAVDLGFVLRSVDGPLLCWCGGYGGRRSRPVGCGFEPTLPQLVVVHM